MYLVTMKIKKNIGKNLFSVIDLGSHSVRMEIVQIDEAGNCETLENVSNPIPIGNDVFTKGTIAPESIRLVAKILNDYRVIMKGYGAEQWKAVATSAVREASNRDLFIERIEHLSGIKLEVLEASEEVRLIYLSVKDILEKKYPLSKQDAVVCIIGTGSIHMILEQNGKVKSSETFRIGTLRLYEEIGQPASGKKVKDIIDIFVGCVVDDITKNYPKSQKPSLFVAVGAPVRALMNTFSGDKEEPEILTVSRKKLEAVHASVAGVPSETLAEKHHLTDLIAQSLEPCCDILEHFIQITDAQKLVVPMITTRDAIIDEILRGFSGTDDPFTPDVISSAEFLGEKYRYDAAHGRCASDAALAIFDSIQQLHGVGKRGRLMLEAAALLHDIGQYVNNRQHHKHSYYIISNSQMPGISPEELDEIAVISRYHRRGLPKESHIEYMALSPEKRVEVNKLAGILRIADALDRSNSHKIKNIKVSYDEEKLTITTNASFDLTLERMEVRNKGDLFTDVFGLRVVIE
jgi:exopolyphosphatase/guanosine-5'-triphosphate,3'-diphosphate pyrophosphatase